MKLESSRLLPVDRDTVWAALNDPEALKAAIPGCESMERVADDEYAAVVAAAIGPVKARFRGKLKLADVVPPERYTLQFEGQAGPAGHARGSARVALTPEDGGTRLAYAASAQVGGRLAQVGQRLIDAAAAKVADDFFAAFSAQLAERAGGAPETAAPAAAAPAAKPAWRPPWWAMAVLAALAAAILLFLPR